MRLTIFRSLNVLGYLAFLLTSLCAQPIDNSIAIINSTYNSEWAVAPNSIAAIFGQFITLNQEYHLADPQTLATNLGGVSVTVNGKPALLQFSSPIQISILVPPDTPLGMAEVVVRNANNLEYRGTMEVSDYVPGIYTATTKGQGSPAGLTTFDNQQFESLNKPDGTGRELDPGTPERPNQVILVGTAIRGVPAENPNDENGVAESVKIYVQGLSAKVLYAGPFPGYTGVDQIRFVLPPQVAGLTTATLRTIVGEKSANFLKLNIAARVVASEYPELEPERETVGYLATQDRRMVGNYGHGQQYYFDAYRIQVGADSNVVAELYSVQFDPAVVLYRRLDDGSLEYVSADDQTYGMDNTQDLNHALLMTRVQEAGEYVLCVTSSAADPLGIGRYTLRLRLQGYQVQPLFYGSTISGLFTSNDIRSAGGNYIDAFTFNGTAGDVIKVQVNSLNFDPLVILMRNNGDYVAEDDNSGGGKNAQLVLTLPATGRYKLFVTPYETWHTGNYTLKLTSQGTAAVTENLKAEPAAPGRYWGGSSREINSAHFGARRILRAVPE